MLDKVTEDEKRIVKKLVKALPNMTDREQGYVEGTIMMAAAMSTRKREEENERDIRETV